MNDFIQALMSDVEDSPWLEGVFDWGRDVLDDVVYPMMDPRNHQNFDAVQTGAALATGAANTAASGLGALMTAPAHGVDATVAGLDRRMNPNNPDYSPLVPQWQPVGEDAEQSLAGTAQALETLYRPVAATGEALGDATMELTGNPEAATAAHVAPDALLAALGVSPTLRNARVGLPKRDLGYSDLFPDRALEGPKPTPPPVGPTGRGGPGKYQEGAIKVHDPEADTIGDMFATSQRERVIPGHRSNVPVDKVQGDFFPQPTPMMSVIPEAIERLERDFPDRYIPAKEMRNRLQSYGVKPQELEAYGLTGFLDQAEAEKWELLPSDLADNMTDNELLTVTGGNSVAVPELAGDGVASDQHKIISDHLTNINKRVTELHTTGDVTTKDLIRDAWNEAVGSGAISGLAVNTAENGWQEIERKVRSQMNSLITSNTMAPGQSPYQMREEVVDMMKTKYLPEVIPNAIKTPELMQKLDKVMDEFGEQYELAKYWRQKAMDPATNYSNAVDDSNQEMIDDVQRLTGSGYQDSFKYPGSLDDTITTFNMPNSAFGGRVNDQAYHFQAPNQYSTIGHRRGSRRLVPETNLYQLDVGEEIETASHTDERQFDPHRMAQSAATDSRSRYGRELRPLERQRLSELDAQQINDEVEYQAMLTDRDLRTESFDERLAAGEEGVMDEFNAWRDIWDEEAKALTQKMDDSLQERKKLKAIPEGKMPNLPYKERVEQSVLAIKDAMIQAALRGDEWVTIASERQQAENQGSQEGYTYVEEAVWDGNNWVIADQPMYDAYSSNTIPKVEINKHLPDDLKDPDNLPTIGDFYRAEAMYRLEDDADFAENLAAANEDYTHEGYTYQNVSRIPDEYTRYPEIRSAIRDAGYDPDDWFWEYWRYDDVAEAIGRAHDLTDAEVRDIANEMRSNERPAIWDSRETEDGQPLAVEGSDIENIEDWIFEEAERVLNDMDEHELASFMDDDGFMLQEVIAQGDYFPSVSIHDDVIMDSDVAGAAANYADEISIPAIRRIHREMGEPPYEPIHKPIAITDDAHSIDVDDPDTVDHVLAFRMTPNMVDKIMTESRLFAPLNPWQPKRTREERRRDSMERRRKNPESYLFEGRVYPEPELELELDEPDEFWTGDDLPPGNAGAMRVKSMQRAQGLYPAGRLEGLPETVYVPGKGETEYGNFQPAIDMAKGYMDSKGMSYTPPAQFAELDKGRAKAIADEYERAPDISEMGPEQKAETLAAYDAMIAETLDQYQLLVDSGLKVDFNYDYAQTRDVIDDVIDNNHMSIFPTDEGFGVDPNFDYSQNPLLRPTKYKTSDGKPMLANDVFRAVHDYFGHVKNGVGFRARGEEAAWQAHASMYSPEARRAMTSETRGQNSWVNYGPEGERNRTASPEETIYADQKTTLLPNWVSEEGRLSAKDRRERFQRLRQDDRTGFEGAIGDDGKVPIVHYSHAPVSRTDPAKWGAGLSRTVWSERERIGQAPGRTFYGLEAADENPYRKERGLGSFRNEARVDPELIYNLDQDPENLWHSPNFAQDRAKVLSENEKRIKDAGYVGYMRDHPTLGKTLAVFDELNVVEKSLTE